jgi:hypothetical protein
MEWIMLRVGVLSVVGLVGLTGVAAPQEPPEVWRVAEAVSALPETMRANAEVRLFRNGDLVTVRSGGNGLICLGNDPDSERWHVACYHESLEPFMARGRQLRAQGVTERAVIDSIRSAEIESGELGFPAGPAALYSLTGEKGSFNPETGEAEGAGALYVLYVPYGTEASTGVSTVPSRARPWLMASGKPWAHVMISR